jgi:alkanesulfonate monooxygenase SsuD/methylene tetrahydromethanopterin reductase-like flavin-dependent oxidoreductase (luciferase family)
VPYRGYDLEEITLVPRPKNEVEWWQPVVSASDRAINFMAKWGIKGIIGGGAATGGASDDVIQRWQAIHGEHGKDYKLGEGLIVGYSVQIADTEKEAMDQARLWMEERVKMFGPLGFIAGLSEEQLAALNAFGRPVPQGLKMPTIEESVAAGQYLVGPPERITEQLMAVQERYPGLEEVNIGVTNMGMPTSASLEQLEWFAQDVMPHFTRQNGGN